MLPIDADQVAKREEEQRKQQELLARQAADLTDRKRAAEKKAEADVPVFDVAPLNALPLKYHWYVGAGTAPAVTETCTLFPGATV